MSRLVESIKIKNGRIYNIKAHNHRFNRTRMQLWKINKKINLKNLIHLPKRYQTGLVKCRILYDARTIEVVFEFYRIKKINSLQIVRSDDICYSYKYESRESIRQLFAQRKQRDDILIIKNSLITDSSYCNVALFDGKYWKTPAKPLLHGTQRARLLRLGRIQEANIALKSLNNYTKIRLFNAMIPFGQNELNINNIYH